MTDGPPLSIVIHTTDGWPVIAPALERLVAQAESVDGEVIVADGTSGPIPRPSEIDRRVRWEGHPGESVVRLRHHGYLAASGAVVAATEDHCEPVGQWACNIVEAHARHPDAAAIGGAVDNGATDHLIDWAYYLVTQRPWISPLDRQRLVGHTNISYKRWAARAMPFDGPLSIEILYNAHLRRAGHEVAVDERIRVLHDKCMGVLETHELEFHNARTIGGLHRSGLGLPDLVRVVAPFSVALFRAARDIRSGLGKEVPRGVVVRSAPFVVSLQVVHSVGEVVGYLTSQGDSPTRLH